MSSPESSQSGPTSDGGLTHIESWPCDYCGDRDHTIFDCEDAEEYRRERRESAAARRLDPVARDPEFTDG